MTTLTYTPFARSSSASATVSKAAPSLSGRFAAWRQQRRRDNEDRQLWDIAQQDPRIMTDLVCALRRAG